MKVQPSSGGLRQYYRHSIVQAVLYREFIKRSRPLEPWFAGQGLRQSLCRSAVVAPSLSRSPQTLTALQRLCDAFDVTLIQVPHEAAEYRHMPVHPVPSVPRPRQHAPRAVTVAVDAPAGTGPVGPSVHSER